MINEDAIDRLIQPILDAQDKFEFSVLQKIALRIRQISTLSYSSAIALVRSLFAGEDILNIERELAQLSKTQRQRIENVIKALSKQIYAEAEVLYRYREVDYPAFEKNKELCDLMYLLIDEIDDEYLGYIGNEVFIIRSNPSSQLKRPMNINGAYHSVLNEAAQLKQTNTDFNSGMSRTIDQLLDSGLRYMITGADDKTRSFKITNLVKSLLVEKTKELNTKMQAIMSGQYGADGIELSAHINSAPDHEPVQGRQFLKEEFDKLQSALPFQDIKKNWYEAIIRPIGAWNCRHWTKAIIIGVSVPEYSEKQLKKMIADNKRGYTAPNGKHYTMYECTQMQRIYERNITDYETRYKIAKYSGNTELQQKYFAKYSQYVNGYKAFSKACNLPINSNKL